MANPTEITVIPITDLRPDGENANLGTERGREALDHALRERRAARSILLDKHGRIIAGNKSAAAAAANGIAEVLVIPTDGTRLIAHQRTDLDLDEPEGRLAAFEDNQIAALDLSFDVERILEAQRQGIDLSHLWNNDEMDALRVTIPDFEPVGLDEQGRLDEKAKVCCPQCGHEFVPSS